MNLLSYIDYILENSGFFKLYYSDSFRSHLKMIRDRSDPDSGGYKISVFLLRMEDNDQITDKNTLIDITDKNDTISFIQGNRILRKYQDLPDSISGIGLSPNIVSDKNNELWKTGRTKINIGRWSRKLIKDNHRENTYTDSMVENFVNNYKSTFDLLNNASSLFKIVEGEEIRKWYLESNYKKKSGQLGNSCMAAESKQKFLDIYTKNPQVCKLLIMKDIEDDSKIVGRSLLWKLDDGLLYQDRVYTINDSDKIIFDKWATDNGYLLHWKSSGRFMVTLGDYTYKYYPYMDTFVVYNPVTKKLSDDIDLWPGQGYIKIQNTDGSYTSADVVWSEYYDSYINIDDAIEAYASKDRLVWINKVDAVYLDYRHEYWVSDPDIMVYSEFHGKFFHLDDVIWSEKLDDWLWVDSKDIIEIKLNSYGDVDYVPKRRLDLYVEDDGVYVDISNCIKDPYTGKYQFKDKMISDRTYQEYLLGKLKEELGTDKDLMIKKVINLFKEAKYPDIRDIIKDDKLYQNIWGVYWGLSKDKKPTEDDMICLLFVNILNNKETLSKETIKKFSDDVYNKYDLWYNTDRRLTFRINKFIKSFDYTLLGDEIYKIYLWFSL